MKRVTPTAASFIVFIVILSSCNEFDRIPKVNTLPMDTVSYTQATAVGDIFDMGEDDIEQHGFCWGTEIGPDITDSVLNLGSTSSLGQYSGQITNLVQSTTYYLKAYVISKGEPYYGEQINFSTLIYTLPDVSTDSIGNITANSAKVYGHIISDGGDWVSEGGVYYGTNPNPDKTGIKLSSTSGSGEYTVQLTELSAGTKYYVMAYAKNTVGMAFGNEQNFTTATSISAPTVSTSTPTDITTNSATVGGIISSDGGSTVTERGVYYGTMSEPQTTGTKMGIMTGAAEFSASLTGLTEGTRYFVIAYAINSEGTAFGSEVSFTTGVSSSTPSVSTAIPTDITTNSATVGGEVTDDGGSTVSERGIYYGISANPETTGTKLQIGQGNGSFSTNLPGLQSGTTYYIKAYATNSEGTSFGNEEIFATEAISAVAPTVTTNSILSITTTSAIVGGEVVSDGGAAITDQGIWYGTTANPEQSGTKLPIDGTGAFSTTLSDLIPETVYFLRAYATNSIGTAYGDEISFATRGQVTDYDGNVYSTVKIGDQWWMAENLKTTHYSNGAAIPLVEDNAEWDLFDPTDTAYCYYQNNASYGALYGALYTWVAAMKGANSSDANPSGVQGVCPNGWHLPSIDEWETLIAFLGGHEVAGGKLREAGTLHWNVPNEGATNESNFTALPAGSRHYNGGFDQLGSSTYWWSATEASENSGTWIHTHNGNTNTFSSYGNKHFGESVRCVKD